MEKGGALTAVGEFMIFASHDQEVSSFLSFHNQRIRKEQILISHMKLLPILLAIGRIPLEYL
jgi:hypothetical protein